LDSPKLFRKPFNFDIAALEDDRELAYSSTVSLPLPLPEVELFFFPLMDAVGTELRRLLLGARLLE
jgi:hypothetical protein